MYFYFKLKVLIVIKSLKARTLTWIYEMYIISSTTEREASP